MKQDKMMRNGWMLKMIKSFENDYLTLFYRLLMNYH